MTRNLLFEWRRASTIRSTWGFPLMGIAMLIALGIIGTALAGSAGDTESQTLTGLLAATTFPLGIVVITVICAQAFGHDYRDGTMRLVLSEFPGRGRVFWSKMLVPMVIVGAAIVVAEVLLVLINLVILRYPTGDVGQVAALAARSVILTMWWGLVIGAITALMRNLAGGIVVAIVAGMIGESLLLSIVAPKWEGIIYLAPFTNALQWAGSGALKPGLTALVWMVALVGAALWLFRKRDA